MWLIRFESHEYTIKNDTDDNDNNPSFLIKDVVELIEFYSKQIGLMLFENPCSIHLMHLDNCSDAFSSLQTKSSKNSFRTRFLSAHKVILRIRPSSWSS